MPRLNGIEATRRITAVLPEMRVIGLSMHEQADMAEAMRRAGAVGYFPKDGLAEQLVAAIRQTAATLPSPPRG
jgi:DNA-binding NarL/FixJ family response regulator